MRFAKCIFESHPHWFKYARGVENTVDGLSVFTLEIAFPSENPNVAEPMVLTVDLHRIIVLSWFSTGGPEHSWHVDWVMYMPSVWEVIPPENKADEDYGFKMAARLADRFFAEEVVAWWRDRSSYYGTPQEVEAMEPEELFHVTRSWRRYA